MKFSMLSFALLLTSLNVFSATECLIKAEIEGTKFDYQTEVAHETLQKKGYTISYGQYDYKLSANYIMFDVRDYSNGKTKKSMVFDNGVFQKSEVNVSLKKENSTIAQTNGKAQRYIIASGYAMVRNSLKRAIKSLPNCSDL